MEHRTSDGWLLTKPKFEACFQEGGPGSAPLGELPELPWGKGPAWPTGADLGCGRHTLGNFRGQQCRDLTDRPEGREAQRAGREHKPNSDQLLPETDFLSWWCPSSAPETLPPHLLDRGLGYNSQPPSLTGPYLQLPLWGSR